MTTDLDTARQHLDRAAELLEKAERLPTELAPLTLDYAGTHARLADAYAAVAAAERLGRIAYTMETTP